MFFIPDEKRLSFAYPPYLVEIWNQSVLHFTLAGHIVLPYKTPLYLSCFIYGTGKNVNEYLPKSKMNNEPLFLCLYLFLVLLETRKNVSSKVHFS